MSSKFAQIGAMSPSIHRSKHMGVLAALLLLGFIYYIRLAIPWESVHHIADGGLTGNSTPMKTGHSNAANIITKNAAAIIETRPLGSLVPLILHFASVLGPDWPIILFTSSDNYIPKSAPLHRAIDNLQLAVVFLPDSTSFSDHLEVSHFLTSTWFWEQLAPAEHVLLFQADSIICSASERRVDDYLEYDFVGAPIDLKLSHGGGGYNGGLSLRNRSMVLDIVTKSSWFDEYNAAENKIIGDVEFEDQWFNKKMKEIGARLPSEDVAKTFAVETIWFDSPLGYHQASRWQEAHMSEVDERCPEYRLTTNELFIGAGGNM